MSMHNVAPYVGECIDSILAQTFENFELLIVDDGSDDNSAEIVRSYADKRIKLIERKHDYIASYLIYKKDFVAAGDLLNGTVLANPTVMMRAKTF